MKVLVTGSRDWKDVDPIAMVINSLEPGDTLIHGAAPGADSIANKLAEDRKDIIIDPHPAEWDRYGKSAGPRRNIEMLNLRPDRVYAFPLSTSIGTYHTIKEAQRMDMHVIVCKRVDSATSI